MRRTTVDGKPVTILMHRAILKTPKGVETDHINRDKLDNRRENLRRSTRSLNCLNKRPEQGVYLDKRSGKWKAAVTIDGFRKYLGTFSEKAAALVVRNAYRVQAGIDEQPILSLAA